MITGVTSLCRWLFACLYLVQNLPNISCDIRKKFVVRHSRVRKISLKLGKNIVES